MPTKKSKKSEQTETAIPETKEQKLSRLAAKRVTKACKYISLVGNLAAYRPTDKDIDKMMEALGQSCAQVEARLRGTRKESFNFTLN